MTIRVALAGCGGWGKNLLRVLTREPLARVVAVVDPDPAALAWASHLAPEAAGVTDLEGALAFGIDAVVIATPPETHAALALRAMEAGADVLVEKPLALSAEDAAACVARAKALGRVAMVGHLLRYHPTVARLIDDAQAGRFGEVLHVRASRLSTGGSPSESPASILWRLGPHDLSVLDAISGSIASASARELGRGLVRVSAKTESGASARVDLSRSHGEKARLLTIVSRERIAVFDDVSAPFRLLVGDVRARGSIDEATIDEATIEEIVVPFREPLAVEVEHFLCCVRDRSAPRTPFSEGARVVSALCDAEASLSEEPSKAAASPSDDLVYGPAAE